MQTASGLPIRKRIRLRNFHYGGNCAYYVTICAHEKRMLFGTCMNGIVRLSTIGSIVMASWLATEAIHPGVVLDEWIVMPNHLHGIVHVPPAFTRQDLFRIIRGFKSQATAVVRTALQNPQFVLWQKRFNDRIIRSQRELQQIREYIRANPARWGL